MGILRIDENTVLRAGNLLRRVVETFVVAQLRAELSIAETRPRLYHLRQEQGRREVVLHTGKRTYPLGERISAAPICTLWV